MDLRETCSRVGTAGAARVAIVLDASESAQAHEADIAALARQIANGLPAPVERSLYFLGNAAPYRLTEFAARSAEWFRGNRKRGSLLTPLYEALEDAEGVRVVVIGSGRIFDLADWADTPQLANTLLVSLGEPLQGQPTLAEELCQPSAQDVCRRLYDPPVRVELSGPGFMPTRWDNPDYRLTLTGGAAMLVGDRLKDYAVNLQCFIGVGSDLDATVTRASGAQGPLAVAPAALGDVGGADAGRLGPREAEAFRLAVRHQPFRCPVCGEECDWDCLRCHAGGGFGHLVYPSIAEHVTSGFVVLREERDGVAFQAAGGSVLRLGPGAVVLKAHGQPMAICRFEPRTAAWTPTNQPVETYLKLEGNAYAILV